MKGYMKIYTLLLNASFLVVLSSSCQKKLEIKYAKAAEVYAELISQPDSLKTIEINFDLEEEELVKAISAQIEKHECLNTIVFKLMLNSTSFPFKLKKKCPDDPMEGLVMSITPEVVIRTNYKGEILYNGKVLSKIGILSNEIEKDLGLSIEEQRYRTNLKWQKKTPIDSLFQTFNQIKVGYLKVYKRESKNEYEKTIEALSNQEINELKMKIPYLINILLRSYEDSKMVIPPPPPPRIE
jgi:hypothetical protein